jgi:hypothetical protein
MKKFSAAYAEHASCAHGTTPMFRCRSCSVTASCLHITKDGQRRLGQTHTGIRSHMQPYAAHAIAKYSAHKTAHRTVFDWPVAAAQQAAEQSNEFEERRAKAYDDVLLA